MADNDLLKYLPAGLGVIGGGIQALLGGSKQHKATKALEKLKTPTYTPNKAIGDYYKTALQRYDTNPFQSAEYQYAQKQANRSLATGIAGLQDRRGALSAIPALVDATDNSLVRAGIAAQQQRNAAFAGLGNATQMQAGDDRMAFQQNVLAPYQKKYNLLSAKASAAGQTLNAGLSNIYGGLANASAIANASDDSSYGVPQQQPFSYAGGLGNQIPDASGYRATYRPAGLRYSGY